MFCSRARSLFLFFLSYFFYLSRLLPRIVFSLTNVVSALCTCRRIYTRNPHTPHIRIRAYTYTYTFDIPLFLSKCLCVSQLHLDAVHSPEDAQAMVDIFSVLFASSFGRDTIRRVAVPQKVDILSVYLSIYRSIYLSNLSI